MVKWQNAVARDAYQNDNLVAGDFLRWHCNAYVGVCFRPCTAFALELDNLLPFLDFTAYFLFVQKLFILTHCGKWQTNTLMTECNIISHKFFL